MRCRRIMRCVVVLLCVLGSVGVGGVVPSAQAQIVSKGCPGRTFTDLDLPPGVCCLSGYVIGDGSIVEQAQVELYGPDGALIASTYTSVDATHPNPLGATYSFRLAINPIPLQVGDTVMLTATIGQQRRTVKHVLRPGAQWVNIGSALFDLDRDGRTDSAVFRPSNGTWYLLPSMLWQPVIHAWGAPHALPVPGDYDGDGMLDIATFEGGQWSIRGSTVGDMGVSLGLPDDLPIPADYDGDADADPAVFRIGRGGGMWEIQLRPNKQTTEVFGEPGDLPLPADYDGDHISDLAVFRPATGTWLIRASTDPAGVTRMQRWGQDGDRPVPADYDGDGKADLAVFRPSDGVWYIFQSTTGTERVGRWGLSGDHPVPGDYDNDGVVDIAVFRPDDGLWYVWQSSTASLAVWPFGQHGDIPLPGVYVP